ncbi:uncharacterized protein LOC112127554 [Cimex lectularius]|uniref:Uncharacterized protein n=1 Tax=Cimex lectularius TaxID=79782 RepID=A0A8I6SP80_CIMLE|nr:uncharacterized protein LOC112127554 [Cimex lectularius]
MYGILTITERMVLDTVTLHTKVPYNAQIPHKEPLERYTALILFTPGGILTYVGNLYVWICKRVDIIQEKDFQEFLTAGDIIVVDRDIFDHNPSLPEGVSAIVFDESWEDLKYTRDDLMRRLMEYEAIKCVPSELSQYPNVVWRVIALLVNYSYLTRPMK